MLAGREHRLVHPAGEGPHRRGVRRRARGRRPGAAAGRGRAGPPVRPGPGRQTGPAAPAPQQVTVRPGRSGCSTRSPRHRRSSRNGRMDLLATNALGRALYSPVYDDPPPTGRTSPASSSSTPGPRLPPRLGRRRRHHCGDPAHRGRPRPGDPDLRDLVGELSTGSEEFRARWAAHDVRLHRTGVKVPPPRRRRPGPRLPLHGPAAEPGPAPDHIHRRARDAVARTP